MARILIAGLFHETHTFLEGSTSLADFFILRDEQMLACYGDASPLGGVLETGQAVRLGDDAHHRLPRAAFRHRRG